MPNSVTMKISTVCCAGGRPLGICCVDAVDDNTGDTVSVNTRHNITS